MFHKKNYFLLITCCWFSIAAAFAQDQKIADSLARIYRQDTLRDTARLELLLNLSFNEVRDLKQSVRYAEDLINLSKAEGNDSYLRAGYFTLGQKKRLLGNLDEAMAAFIKSAELANKYHNFRAEGDAYGELGNIYSDAKNHPTAMTYYSKASVTLRQLHDHNDSNSLAVVLSNAGDEFVNVKIYDSALLYFNESKIIFDKLNYLSGKGYCLGDIGMVYANIGKNELAEKNINQAIYLLEQNEDYQPVCEYLLSMDTIYLSKGKVQTALDYAIRSLHFAKKYGLIKQVADANLKLSEIYERLGDSAQAYLHYKNYILYRDSVNNIKSEQKRADLRFDFEFSKKQTEVDLLNQKRRNQRNVVISLIVILGLTVIILGILLNNNKNKQKAYAILDKQKQEIDEQKAKAEEALNELQVTQKQLIQSEKMASLGELTAGIAHEIQNPLNFVNNFSEVSSELLEELIERTLSKLSASDKAAADEIINDLADNLKKIGHHGKRADSIVKGMLLHSRTSANRRESTDINALADEYLRLSYHGLRAKDNTFNVSIETSFDNNIDKLIIVPQDIGRVLLNIYNNAFYSLIQKTKLNIEGYQPKLWLTTTGITKDGDLKSVRIQIRDNGIGIPDAILNKIYQPFFTTKPTGQGVGLGLFFSYDIITNEHQGQLKVESKEGEYAEFLIELSNKK
jgi:two-component system NtrC family sensor kinase